VARLAEVEATVQQALDQLPTLYSAGLCHEDAATALEGIISQIEDVAEALREMQRHIEY
jgi:hypothetical protein